MKMFRRIPGERVFVDLAICWLIFCLSQPASMAQSGTPSEDGNQKTPAVTTPTAPTAPAATARNSGYIPLTQSERFGIYVKRMFNAESILRSSAGAAILQGTDTPQEWGQDGDGYGRRFANSYGQHIIRSTLMYGSSSILHEDNRYFQSGESGFWPRLHYALTSTVMARHDDGTRHLSFSRLASYTAVAFISRAWQPPSTRGPENAGSSLGVAFGVEAAFYVGREFFPRILHSNPSPGPHRAPGP
jgi:hypothetical protein